MTSPNRLDNIIYSENIIPEYPIGSVSEENVDNLSMREQIEARYTQDTHFRRHLANWVMIIVPAWLLCVITTLILAGCHILYIEPEILITLLATTTINVLGLAYIVLKGIFPESK